ncbi:MAG: hypothetical protein AB1938_02585 [Myxococcota bacterium]
MRLSLVLLALLLAAPAWAQKIVVLEIDGDSNGKLRSQIEDALKAANVVTLVSLSAYKKAAASQKLKGAAAMTPAGVARTSRAVRFDAAVGGEVDATHYTVLIYDRAGQELWTKRLAVKKGLLSDDFATKLARAIAAAGEQGASRPAPGAETGETGASGETGETGETGEGGIDLTAGASTPPPPEDPNRDTDLDTEGKKRKRATAEVPLVRGWLAGTTTWRSQCLRPGVTACKEYDQAMPRPEGITIDFSPNVPYLGFDLGVEVYPLARIGNDWLRGFTFLAEFHFGQSLTRIVEETPQGMGMPVTVTSNDLGWYLQVGWRYFFGVGYGKPTPLAHVGVRAGLQGQMFNIDPTAGTALPSSQRTYPTGLGFPVFGVDASVPIAPFFRVDLGVSLFLNPRPAPEQIIGYGNLNDPTGGASSTGWGLTGGFSGDVWGPLGWMLQVRYLAFSDRYYGQGQKWTVCNDVQCGGAGEESFVSIVWGVTAKY